MTTATLDRVEVEPVPAMTGFGRLLRSEWTKLRSVRSTAWSLVILVIAAIGLNTLIVAVTIASWNTTSAAQKHIYAADPTGFLVPALALAEIPLCVLGVMLMTSEYSTGMIRASVLAVPRRIPMLAAKAAVLAALALVVGELIGFASYLIAQRIIGGRLPESLGDLSTLRAVAGVGLYFAVLSLFSLAAGTLIRHTGAAITAVVGFLIVVGQLAGLIPGSAGQHIQAYLPAPAGLLITHAHQESSDLMSPWQGFGVFCLWTVLLLGAATYLLKRRDV